MCDDEEQSPEALFFFGEGSEVQIFSMDDMQAKGELGCFIITSPNEGAYKNGISQWRLHGCERSDQHR